MYKGEGKVQIKTMKQAENKGQRESVWNVGRQKRFNQICLIPSEKKKSNSRELMSVRHVLFSVSCWSPVVSHADPLIPKKREGFSGYQHMRHKKIKKNFKVLSITD